jgi:5,5'-dehydrodivanillate O-demethylase oxygenase subunit
VLTEAENIRLTETSAGTPAGELLRRYWHPIAPQTAISQAKPTHRVRIMGENLVLYRDLSGNLGLVQERCPHRSASLALGIPQDQGIRCPYHGWQFNSEGQCLSQPFEEVDGPGFKDRVAIPAYPVQELGGLIFAYMGPQPAPLLPRYDVLADEKQDHYIGITELPCSWLQCQENSADPVHFEWLHAEVGNMVAARLGLEPVMTPKRHLKIDFDLFEFGIMKRRLLEGDDPETSPDWNIGHPLLFPNMLAGGSMQFRVPIDDEHTLHFTYGNRPCPEGEKQKVVVRDIPLKDSEGEFVLNTIVNQDFSAWVTQGPVTPRHLEHLGRSDLGVTMLRQWLSDNIAKVQRGEEPGALIRDPAINTPSFVIPGMTGQRLTSVQTMTPTELAAKLQAAESDRAASAEPALAGGPSQG